MYTYTSEERELIKTIIENIKFEINPFSKYAEEMEELLEEVKNNMLGCGDCSNCRYCKKEKTLLENGLWTETWTCYNSNSSKYMEEVESGCSEGEI